VKALWHIRQCQPESPYNVLASGSESLRLGEKQMSGSITFDVKIGRIRAVDMPHNLRQITRGRLKQQVIMGIHHAVCVNERIISLCCGLKVFKKFLPVTFAFEDSFALIST
jgi:hypothetical protein